MPLRGEDEQRHVLDEPRGQPRRRPPEQLGALYFIIGATDGIYGVMKLNREAQPGARRLVERHRGGLPETLLDMSQSVIVSVALFVAPDQVGADLGRVTASQVAP